MIIILVEPLQMYRYYTLKKRKTHKYIFPLNQIKKITFYTYCLTRRISNTRRVCFIKYRQMKCHRYVSVVSLFYRFSKYERTMY